jgi:hypothetical protein
LEILSDNLPIKGDFYKMEYAVMIIFVAIPAVFIFFLIKGLQTLSTNIKKKKAMERKRIRQLDQEKRQEETKRREEVKKLENEKKSKESFEYVKETYKSTFEEYDIVKFKIYELDEILLDYKNGLISKLDAYNMINTLKMEFVNSKLYFYKKHASNPFNENNLQQFIKTGQSGYNLFYFRYIDIEGRIKCLDIFLNWIDNDKPSLHNDGKTRLDFIRKVDSSQEGFMMWGLLQMKIMTTSNF